MANQVNQTNTTSHSAKPIYVHIRGIVLLVALLLIFSYPMLNHLVGSTWLADSEADWDVYMKMWDSWYFNQMVWNGAEFFHTDFLFYPEGASLVYHNFNVPYMLVMSVLTPFIGAVSAFNLTALILMLANAISGYWFSHRLTKNLWAAILGGIIMGFLPYVVGNIRHPDLTLLVLIPPLLVFFHIAMTKCRWWAVVSAAITLAIHAYIGMYILVVLTLTLLGLFANYALRANRWKQPSFWITAVIFGLLTLTVAMPRILPMIQDRDALDFALEEKYANASPNHNVDLVNYVLPTENPFFRRIEGRFFPRLIQSRAFMHYLGLTTLALATIGLISPYRKQLWGWLTFSVFFAILALGPVLYFNGTLTNIVLPKFILDDLLPIVFQSFGWSRHFHVGIIVPLMVMAVFGFKFMLEKLQRPTLRNALGVFVLIAVSVDLWTGNIKGFDMQQFTSPYYAELRDSDESLQLIQLPMGRRLAKLYLYFQTIHQQPMVEGLVSRTPDAAYDTIDANLILSQWLENKTEFDCANHTPEIWSEAAQELVDLGFDYVIVHHEYDRNAGFDQALSYLEPTYRDELISVYATADFAAAPPCTIEP